MSERAGAGFAGVRVRAALLHQGDCDDGVGGKVGCKVFNGFGAPV